MPLEPIKIFAGKALPLLRDNIDTDQIIPSREMKTVSKLGLGEGLFAGWRYMRPGGRDANPEFVLNQPGYENASIILSSRNFGCGSSREHAVWALHEFGFRVIIAESFGEIFYNNCVSNGILPIQASADHIEKLAGYDGELEINLPEQNISFGPSQITFDIPPGDKRMLVEGLDAIALTEKHNAEIDAFFSQDKENRPWAY